MNYLALIPARGGSKGIPKKNIKLLRGKPLVQYSFECALSVQVFDRIIISTEDLEIKEMAQKIGIDIPFMRPDSLAQDDTPMIEVIKHTINRLCEDGFYPDIIALLQPSSPLRKPEHLLKALKLLENNDSVCSVTELPKDMCPHYVMKIDKDGYLNHFLPDGKNYKRRQDVPQAYKRDGTIYLTRAETIQRYGDIYGEHCMPMIIPQSESINIDTPEDWEKAEQMLKDQ